MCSTKPRRWKPSRQRGSRFTTTLRWAVQTTTFLSWSMCCLNIGLPVALKIRCLGRTYRVTSSSVNVHGFRLCYIIFRWVRPYEVFMRPADIYMLGHAKIGDAIRRAGLFAANESPFMLQECGWQHHACDDNAHDGGVSGRQPSIFIRIPRRGKTDVVNENLDTN